MKDYRRFCRIVLLLITALLLYNGVIWTLFTRPLLTRHEGVFTGDLARLGYLSAYIQPRHNSLDLPRRHLEVSSYQGESVDVVTVGDSFSQGGGNGPNRYYQDFLASFHQVGVLNVPYYPGVANLMEQVAILLNSGFLDRVHPRYLILEIVERNCHSYAGTIDFEASAPLETVLDAYRKEGTMAEPEEGASDLPQVGFINSGNLKWLLYNTLYLFSDNALFAKVSKVPLKTQLFSDRRGDSLLYLNKDIRNLRRSDEGVVARVNDNLNRLAALLRERGIELYFMPAVDKSNLYRPFVQGARYPESHFFETFRTLPRDYRLIDTKEILQQALERGERDIYYVDDTHWSWKASQAVSRAISFR